LTAPGEEAQRWSLTLYVSGASPHSAQALDTVRRVCDEELAGQVDLRVVDVAEEPDLAGEDQILAVPTLVRRLPAPVRQLVGDLADVERVRAGLDLVAPASRSTPPDEEPGEP
jgi:circadian clock protein KaiB